MFRPTYWAIIRRVITILETTIHIVSKIIKINNTILIILDTLCIVFSKIIITGLMMAQYVGRKTCSVVALYSVCRRFFHNTVEPLITDTLINGHLQ
jgi:hypothetical protein